MQHRPPETHPGRVALGIVRAGEVPMVLEVAAAVGVAALQQDGAEDEERPFRLPRPQPQGAVDHVMSYGDDRDEDQEHDDRRQPPPAQPRRQGIGGDAGQRAGAGQPALAPTGRQQIAAQFVQPGNWQLMTRLREGRLAKAE